MSPLEEQATRIIEALEGQPELMRAVYDKLQDKLELAPKSESELDAVLAELLKEKERKIAEMKNNPTPSGSPLPSDLDIDLDDLFDDIPDDVKPKPNPDGYLPGPKKFNW